MRKLNRQISSSNDAKRDGPLVISEVGPCPEYAKLCSLSNYKPRTLLLDEVQPGQTAWTIAAYYEVDLAELLGLNNLTENAILHPGDILLVHPSESPTSMPLPTPTEAALETPTMTTSVSSATPIPTVSSTPETSPRSILTPLILIAFLCVALFVAIAIVRTSTARRGK